MKNIANDMSPLKVVLACALPLLAAASGGWEYEAVYNIDEYTDTYSLNMANNADARRLLSRGRIRDVLGWVADKKGHGLEGICLGHFFCMCWHHS